MTGVRPQSRSSHSLGAAIAFAAAGIISFGFLISSIVFRSGTSMRPGWTGVFSGGAYRVTETDAASSSAGLREGDRILSVDGDLRAGFYGPALALSRVPAGGNYPVVVVRGGTVSTLRLRMGGSEDDWEAAVPDLTVSALLYALGLWIGSVKFRDATGRLAALTFLLTVFTFFPVILAQFPGWSAATSALAVAFANFARPLNLAVGYHFYSRFPQPVPESARGIALRRLLYGAAVLLWLPMNATALAQFAGIAPGPLLRIMAEFRPDGRPGGLLIPLYETLATTLMCVVLGRNYHRLRDPDSRRRIRWAGLAFGATLGGYFLFTSLKVLAYVTRSATIDFLVRFSNGVETGVIALSCVALAYAVTRHRVLGIHVVIRRGVQYLLARNALGFVMILPLLVMAVAVIRHPDRSLRDLLLHEPWSFYAAVTISGAISLRYRNKLRLWLDHRFFRTEAEQERVLVALAERIKTAESEAEICLSAAHELDAALHPSALHIFVRANQDRKLRVVYSGLIDSAGRLGAWLNTGGAQLLERGSAFSVYDCEATPPAALAETDSEVEQLVVPITGADQVNSGALVLGPKRSEVPYTARDRNLLSAVAGQIALVYEVLHLKKRVQQEQHLRPVEFLTECPACARCYTTAETSCPQDGASLSFTLPVERTISDKYRLDRRIGHGGMGVVYEASDLLLGRAVAVKIMVGDLFGDGAALARFEREARVAASLSHPNVVAVHDFGRLAMGGAYLVMDLVAGKSWRQHLRAGRVSLHQISSWMNQLCAAAEAAHAKGIVHRDLKPENIMIADADSVGRVIVLDFGLAKLRSALSEGDQELTLPGTVMGTRGYMSPEQRAGRVVDSSSDVFAVAVICAETVSGRRPPRNGASKQWLRTSLKLVGLAESPLQHCLERGLAEQPNRRPPITEFRDQVSAALADVALRPAAPVSPDDIDTLSMRRSAGPNP